MRYTMHPLAVTKTAVLYVFSLFMLFATAIVQGQDRKYFTINNKQVYIDGLNNEIQKMMTEIGVPGMSFAVIEDNRVVFSNTYGYRRLENRKRATRNTVFEACSLSKSYLAYVAHKLADEGKLDLHKPMYQYLPYQPLEHDPRYKLITPAMILSHCSGLENWRQYNNRDTLEILSNPGERYTYSGEGYNYLAQVVAVILQKPYEQYVNDIVLEPLGLHHSFVQFKQKRSGLFHKESPANYAVGHNYFGHEVPKWKNPDPVPSSANNVTAEDYAKLIIATFDRRHLSEKSIQTILKPDVVVRKTEDNTYYYGSGFEVFYTAGDTIIAHGGSNAGFKSEIFYSVVNKKGFVFFSNSDRGRLMTQRLSELTAGLDIDEYFKNPLEHQYPSTVIDLLKIYRDDNAQAMMTAVEKLNREGKMNIDTWNELGHVLTEEAPDLAFQLLHESYKLNSNLPDIHCLLGDVYWEKQQYDTALTHYLKAKALNFNLWEIKPSFLKDLQERIKDLERRRSLVWSLHGNAEIRIESEEYAAMRGIRVKDARDTGGGPCVHIIKPGDWMDYNVHVASPGTYTVAFRIASLKRGGRIRLMTGSETLISVDVPATGGWENWSTVGTNVNMPAGTYTIRVYAAAGAFDMNWLRFSTHQSTAGN